MSNSHRLTPIATQNVFSWILSLGPNNIVRKIASALNDPNMTLNAKAQRYPIYAKILPTSPSFTSFYSTIVRFQINEVFDFSIGYNCELKRLEKNRKLKISKTPNAIL